ncbi:uncharacterized protein [Dermacentor andersoni]|uniref:uncharacterized protein n=1 Tax=Dermacentor andersoni TaxID=34620 RepID=UPI003B3A3E40
MKERWHHSLRADDADHIKKVEEVSVRGFRAGDGFATSVTWACGSVAEDVKLPVVPGTTSLLPFFSEHGPHRMNEGGDFMCRPFAWTERLVVLFADQQVAKASKMYFKSRARKYLRWQKNKEGVGG